METQTERTHSVFAESSEGIFGYVRAYIIGFFCQIVKYSLRFYERRYEYL